MGLSISEGECRHRKRLLGPLPMGLSDWIAVAKQAKEVSVSYGTEFGCWFSEVGGHERFT